MMHDKRASKFLSLVLRHRPELIGLKLDEHGWANTQDLLEKINAHDPELDLSPEALEHIVETNDKKRFVFSDDHSMIRASQGHSIAVDLQFEERLPPQMLYHGTAEKNLEAIRKAGLIKGSRHHVHLSADPETARKVGMRYGSPVILNIDTAGMQAAGYSFYLSANAVWLTDHVPPRFIKFTT